MNTWVSFKSYEYSIDWTIMDYHRLLYYLCNVLNFTKECILVKNLVFSQKHNDYFICTQAESVAFSQQFLTTDTKIKKKTTELPFVFIELSPFDSSIISFVKNKQFHKNECYKVRRQNDFF